MSEPLVQATHMSSTDDDPVPGAKVPVTAAFAGLKPTYEQLQARIEELEQENRELRKFRNEQKKLEKELSDTLAKVLAGYLPICARCKRIREEDGVWKQLETYIQTHSEVVFSHSLCPTCAKSFYPEFLTPEE